MGRIRVLGYSISVSVAVFLYLGLPMLRRLYGPEVILIAYAGIALIGGGITYSVTMRLTSRLNQTQETKPSDTATIELLSKGELNGDDQSEYYLVEQELEQLQEEE